MRELSIILAFVGAAAWIFVLVRVLRRRALHRLVRERFYSGLCIMCGADLRFGKEQCPKCGYKYDWVTAVIWDDVLNRAKLREQPRNEHRPPQ